MLLLLLFLLMLLLLLLLWTNLCRELLPFVELLLEKLLHRFQAFCHTTVHLHLNHGMRKKMEMKNPSKKVGKQKVKVLRPTS